MGMYVYLGENGQALGDSDICRNVKTARAKASMITALTTNPITVSELVEDKKVATKYNKVKVGETFVYNGIVAWKDKDGKIWGVNSDGSLSVNPDMAKRKEEREAKRWGEYKTVKGSNVPVLDRGKKVGKWAVAVRNDRTGSIRFIGKDGKLTYNVQDAMQYFDEVTIKGEKIAGDRGKAREVVTRMNKERKSKDIKWFVAHLDVDKVTLYDSDGNPVKDAKGKVKTRKVPVGITKSDAVIHQQGFTKTDVRSFIVSLDGQTVARESSIEDARLRAIEVAGYTRNVAISKIKGSLPVPIGYVNRGLNGYYYWTVKVIDRRARDVKGRGVDVAPYVIVNKYSINDKDGSITKVQVGESATDIRNRKLAEEFAKNGINFRVEDIRKRR